jgi:glycosyltransferase involved in cell wall biosynthesis
MTTMISKPISVLFFANSEVRAGVEEHILSLLHRLDRSHFRLHLAATPELLRLFGSDLPRDIEALPLSLCSPKDLGAAFRLARILRERKIEILHSHLFYASLLASPIAWLCRVPVVIETQHGREAWRHGWLKGHFFIDRLVGRCVDHYIAVSNANAGYLTSEKRLPARKIQVIWNGIDLARFQPTRIAPQGIKKSIGFDEGDPLVLVVGRLEPQKGHRVLLDAFPAVSREFPRARLVCIGDGSLRGELQAKARSLGLEGNVRFLGYQSNVPDWVAAADLTVLPSFYEGLPLTAIECLASGKPMVATSVDGTPEVVVNEKTGLTVPPGDAELLAAALRRLLREPELRRQLGAAGRLWVEEQFTIQKQVFKTQELYLRARAESRRRRHGFGRREAEIHRRTEEDVHGRALDVLSEGVGTQVESRR